MALIAPGLDVTDRDFDALRARFHNLIDSAFPDWTDKETANFGNILVELVAFCGDVLTYYQDNQAKEARITTAQLRASLLGLAKLVGYQPPGASAATVDLTFTLAAPPVGTVTINAGDRFRTARAGSPVSLQALATTVIAASADPPVVSILIENSENSEEVFQSTGLPNQEILLNDVPFLDDSLVLTAEDGAYTTVDDFLDSTATDRHVTVSVDANNRARIRFGNAINGTVPQGTITCGYKTGGGAVGNVDANTVTVPESSYSDSFGNPVQVTVANALRASGGRDRQTIEGIRVAAPKSTRVNERTVCGEDYEINAKRLPAVSRALMLTKNQVESIDENTGRLVVIPAGGGFASQGVKDSVLELVTVTYPNTLTFVVEIVDPDYVTATVQATVYPSWGAGTAAKNAQLDGSIRTALAAFFALDGADGAPNPSIGFGFELDGLLALSDVFNVVRDVAGVRRIGDRQSDFLLNGAHSDLELAAAQFPQLGTVVLLNGFTGEPLIP